MRNEREGKLQNTRRREREQKTLPHENQTHDGKRLVSNDRWEGFVSIHLNPWWENNRTRGRSSDGRERRNNYSINIRKTGRTGTGEDRWDQRWGGSSHSPQQLNHTVVHPLLLIAEFSRFSSCQIFTITPEVFERFRARELFDCAPFLFFSLSYNSFRYHGEIKSCVFSARKTILSCSLSASISWNACVRCSRACCASFSLLFHLLAPQIVESFYVANLLFFGLILWLLPCLFCVPCQRCLLFLAGFYSSSVFWSCDLFARSLFCYLLAVDCCPNRHQQLCLSIPHVHRSVSRLLPSLS